MNLRFNGITLNDLGRMNVLLGKNGTGKSTILRACDAQCRNLSDTGVVKYVTPERGGQLKYHGNVETNAQNQDWWFNERRKNQAGQFREMSMTEFRRLETLVLRKIEQDLTTRQDHNFNFDSTLSQINELLDRVKVTRTDAVGFSVVDKTTNASLDTAGLSSGESELISLAIEILSFCYQAESEANRTKNNFLLLDEPDVHLHPDLQYRLTKLLINAAENRRVTIILATHSTVILSALSEASEAKVGFRKQGEQTVKFRTIDTPLQHILPMFGAHPLSNVFNDKPIILVEGDDDERVWSQATRSSNGKIKIWPCAVGSIQELKKHEDEVDEVISSVYESAKAFSLRDRDGRPYEIDDTAHITRMRLFCRASENLILTDDVLSNLNTTWQELTEKMNTWISQNSSHPQAVPMRAFQTSQFNRRDADVKDLRNIFMALCGSNKPWEVVVGSVIAGLIQKPNDRSDHSMQTYLGQKLVNALNLYQA